MPIEKYINKIINADCMEFMKQLPDKCVDLVLTDPPYREYYKRNKSAILAAHRREYRKKYKAFTKEAQTRPWAGEDKLTPEQQAKLKRIANAITAEDIE